MMGQGQLVAAWGLGLAALLLRSTLMIRIICTFWCTVLIWSFAASLRSNDSENGLNLVARSWQL